MTTTMPRYADEVEQLDDFPLREELSWKARKEAEFLYSIARGVMLATGKPGSGKDLFGIALCAMNKYYFRDLINPDKPRKILLDFMPKKAFGEYYRFDGDVIMQEINKMAKAAKMDGFESSNDKKERTEFITESTSKWALEGEGELLLKGSILYLSELKRYCYNRNPHNPFNKFIGSICTIWRHLDLLIIGTHVQKHEIDQYSFLYYVTHWAKCNWSITREHTTDVTISRGQFMQGSNIYNLTGRKKVMHVDGNVPRDFLGGNRFYDLYETKNMVNLKPAIRKEG